MIVSQPFSLPMVSATGIFGAELLPRVTTGTYWIYSLYVHHDQDEPNTISLSSQTPYQIILELFVPPLIDRSFTSYGRRDLCLRSAYGGNIYITTRLSCMVAGLIQYELLVRR